MRGMKKRCGSHYRIDRTTPPSARRAAPFVPEESGLATNATMAATSSGALEAFQQGTGADALEEILLHLSGGDAALTREPFDKPADAFRERRTRQHGVDGDVGPDRRLRQAAGERHLHRFRDSVMNHFRRNVDGGFAGDEDDSAPAGAEHGGQVMPGETDAAHEVGLDDGAPIGVGDFARRVWGRRHPRLLTRMSTWGNRAMSASVTAGSARSPAKSRRGGRPRAASATRDSVRPFTITRAPSAASARAIARPMPAVEPVTKASLSVSWRFMRVR